MLLYSRAPYDIINEAKVLSNFAEVFMKRNSMCPICFLKTVFTRPSKVGDVYPKKKYDEGKVTAPPMGWSSWNTFKNNIDEDLIYDTAVAMKEKGLLAAGYDRVNMDDCWHSSLRDADGNLQGDLTRFRSGIGELVRRINALGLKVGIYSSNGTLTCEDLPASLGNEYRDAYTFAKWGIEFFKYDFCHNVPMPYYAPVVYGIEMTKKGEKDGVFYPCTQAHLEGLAKFMPCKKLVTGCYVSGMDKCHGAMEYDNVYSEEGGEYVLTLCCKKTNSQYEKLAMIIVNDAIHLCNVPPQKFWNVTSRFQIIVKLRKGINKVRIFNPISSRADSSMLQYLTMGNALKAATARVAKESGQSEKPIVYSICEWGKNQPWKWGALAGNMWRTTPDIIPKWIWIKMIYNKTVDLYKYAQAGAYNDPDMLEVGNGNLTEEQNKSHFALWCMMAAPLILGNDIRTISDKVLKIVTNKELIGIDQDVLGKAAKRVVKGSVDILARPLKCGAAVCFFNKKGGSKKASIKVSDLVKDGYAALESGATYTCREVYSGREYPLKDKLEVTLKGDACEVIVLKKN